MRMRYLGLDIGRRHTGVAFADTKDDILFSLETIHHTSNRDLLERILDLIIDKNIDEVVIGLPLLLSSHVGSQALFVKSIAEKLKDKNIH